MVTQKEQQVLLLFHFYKMNIYIRQAFLFFSIIILIVYSNTFQSSWHFDDEPNILLNGKLQISDLSFEQLNQAMRANPSSPESWKLYRPLPCLTFGLNWYFGQENVRGYHAVNIIIHILTAWFLFLTLRLLLRIHWQEKESTQLIDTTALLGALFWALAPIQTQAVTYIVQRMASMAAMFGIIAIYTYLRGRTAASGKFRWFLLCLLAFFAALGSKENAILLLPSLALFEFSFFRHQITKRQIVLFALAAAFVLTAAALFVRYGLGLAPFSFSNPLSFLDSYSNRSFTFSQRILTQPRILLMYLSQIFLPIADRLSIEHEIVLSTSLFSPWTTLPSITVILGLIGGSLVFLKKYPLLCFPILFYFLNHAVESTILQLELIFEHRNYLPSLFLFLPLGVLTARIILYDTPSRPPAFRRTAAAVCATLFLIVSGHATYTRNMAWATDETLWTDAIKKAPNSARAAGHLGEWYRKRGQYETAYRYVQLSLTHAKNAPSPEDATITALNELGVFHYDWNDNKKALDYFNQCLSFNKYNAYCLKNRILVFIRLNKPEKALEDAEILIEKFPYSVEYYYLSSLSSYKIKDFDTALKTINSVGSAFDNYQVMQLIGLILMKKQAYQNSLFFLKRAEELFPSLEGKIALAAVYYLFGRAELMDKELIAIFNLYPKMRIDSIFAENRNNVLDNKMKENFNKKLTEIAKKYLAEQ